MRWADLALFEAIFQLFQLEYSERDLLHLTTWVFFLRLRKKLGF